MADTQTAAERRIVSATDFVAPIKANHPIDFSDCVVEGDVDLQSLRYSHPLAVSNTTFKGHFDASDARFERGVEFSRCTFDRGAYLRGTRIDGDFILIRSEFLAPQGEFGWAFFPGLRVTGLLNVSGARFQGDLDLSNADIGGDFKGLVFEGKPLHIERDAQFSGIRIGGRLQGYGLQIGARFNLEGGVVRNGMFCRSEAGKKQVRIGGVLNMASALIEVECDLSGAVIEGGINLHDAVVNGNVVCAGRDRYPMRIGKDGIEVPAGYLAGVKVSGRIDFSAASLVGHLNLSAAKIGGKVDLNGTHVTGAVNLDSVQIDGGLYATPIRPNEPPEPDAPPPMENLTEQENAESLPTPESPTSVEPPPEPAKLRVSQFDDEFHLDNAKVRISAAFWGAKFSRGLSILNSLIEGTLQLDSFDSTPDRQTQAGPDEVTEVTATVLLLNGTQVNGMTQLNGLRVQGSLSMAGAIFKGGILAGPDAFGKPLTVAGSANLVSMKASVIGDFQGVQIGGDLACRDAIVEGNLSFASRKDVTAKVGGKLLMESVNVTGTLYLGGLVVVNNCELKGATVERGLNADSLPDKPFTVGAHALFDGARVGMYLKLSGARIQASLSLVNAVVEGNLDANVFDKNHPTQVGSAVKLDGAVIKAKANFDGATIGGTFSAERATISGGLSINSALNRSSVGGQLALADLQAAKVELHGTKIKDGVNLRDAAISGTVSMRPSRDFPFEATDVTLAGATMSKAEFRGVTIAGDLDLQNTEVRDGVEILAEGKLTSDVHGQARFIACETARLEIDGQAFRKPILLNLANVGELRFVGAMPRDGVTIDADGMEYQKIELPDNNYKGFLRRLAPFQKSSYVFLENWLRNRGQDDLAKDVFINMNWQGLFLKPKQASARTGIGRFARRVRDWFVWSVEFLWGAFLYVTIGFGVRSHRLLGIWLLLVALSAAIFVNPESVRPIPQRVTAVLPPNETPVDPPGWDSHDAWIMAIQMNLPMVPLVTGEERKPSSREFTFPAVGWRTSYESYAFYISLLSYVLVPLFIAGITGFLKKQK